MAQAHRRLGARVTVIDVGPLLPRDDPELVASLAGHLRRVRGSRSAPSSRSPASSATETALPLGSPTASGSRDRICWSLPAAGPSIEALDLAAAGIAGDG